MMKMMDKIKCILFSEFHPVAGPKIAYQVPEDYISKEQFDAVHVYIITKPELKDRIITINALGHKIIGFPVCIDNPKYARNALIFNLCFVLDANAKTVCYESLVKKLGGYLTALEMETGFLSNEKSKETLPGILKQVKTELNEYGCSSIQINESNIVYLKVVPENKSPDEVPLHEVPIFTVDRSIIVPSQWDLTTQQILPFIDGFNHLSRIAAEADMEINIVKACIRNLLYYDVIKLISIFQYSNQYAATPHLHKLTEDKQMQLECIKFVAKQGRILPGFHDVFMLYCGLIPGTTVRDLCSRCNPHSLRVDERKLIQFGLIKNVIRRLHKYPIKLPNESGSSRLRNLYRWFNGIHSVDEICCETGLSFQELDDKIESDPSIVVCLK
ncbi:GATOR1 complex protein NPRL2-like [Tubulanus polymorphus]|uniref:GATOR1 complex protein NPRL2-like n=1 Tax=Tubulanus polymorphus TaxID=672921 RepID=UPI003DA5737A